MIETVQSMAVLPLGLPAIGVVSLGPGVSNVAIVLVMLAAVLILARQTRMPG